MDNAGHGGPAPRISGEEAEQAVALAFARHRILTDGGEPPHSLSLDLGRVTSHKVETVFSRRVGEALVRRSHLVKIDKWIGGSFCSHVLD